MAKKVSTKIFFIHFFILFLVLFQAIYSQDKTNIIVDSELTFEEAIAGTNAPKDIIQDLILIDVEYFSFDNKLHRGQLVVHKQIKNDIVEIFQLIKQIKFPVAKVIPIVKYGWSDFASMADNNTSSFNYRKVEGTKRLSNHSYGKAIDINPMQNPYKTKKYISPKGTKYNPKAEGTLIENHPITRKFLEKGWQ
jgi:hypothetical protein